MSVVNLKHNNVMSGELSL